MRNSRTLASRVGVVLTSLALVAGCASGGDDENKADLESIEDGLVGVTEGGEPTEGGTLTLAGYSEPRSLDPAVTIAAGTTGGIEMLNIYDSLTRYDAEKKEVVPQLAASLEPDADFRTWTLELRPDVEFSDGTALDAQAVKASQERYAAASAPEAALWNANVEAIEVTDPLTVTYTLATSWPGFEQVLATGPGMIVGPKSGTGESFEPIGAGPFTLKQRSPGERMTLAANPEHWNGKPHLDALEFVYLGDPNSALDSLTGGDIQAAILREPDLVAEGFGADLAGSANQVSGANVALINAEEGRPGNDPRVRRAMQLATDTKIQAERAYGEDGRGSSTLFPDTSRWHSDAAGLEQDTEQAKELLEAAKADGFDGKVQFLDATDPASRAMSQTFKAQLEAVGFEVEIDLVRTVADQISRIGVERDYDVAGWGLNYGEAFPFAKIYATLHSDGTQTYGMATSPEMDALIDDLQAASDERSGVEAMAGIQEQLNEQVPFLTFGDFTETIFWSDDVVRGVQGNSSSMVTFGEAWLLK